jgi:ABC-type lipoprotein release transport system permease subunit
VEYENIMKNIESFIETPGGKDVKVDQIFTNQMFNDLEQRMDAVGWQSVRSYWDNDFKDRKIISGFIKVRIFIISVP